MAFSSDLLAALVDPIDRQGLQYLESENAFYNERTKQLYRVVENGIGILLADDAESVSDDEHNRLSKLIASGQSIATGPRGQT
jgi:uncharacterized protein YbaR (Trm112 family)